MAILLSIVMPAYNEQDCIAEVVGKWVNLLRDKFTSENGCKLIVVNDGSKDKTGEILDSIQPDYPELVIVHQPNGGHGVAVVHAYKKALELNSEYVFQTDSDDQFVTEDFMKLWEKRDQSDFILGFRKQRFDAPIRLIITKILRAVIWLYFGTHIKDSNIPFRLIKGTYLKKLIDNLPDPVPFAPNIFIAVMAKKAGQNLMNIPITHKDRQTGTVSIKKMKLLKVCYQSYLELADFKSKLKDKVKNIKAA